MKVINGKSNGFIGGDKIYIGRMSVYYNLNASPLFNPFKITKDCSREESIKKYKQHLWKSIKAMRDGQALDSITIELINIARAEYELSEGDSNFELKLVCYCYPKRCHGDVIISALNWLKTQDFFMRWIYS